MVLQHQIIHVIIFCNSIQEDHKLFEDIGTINIYQNYRNKIRLKIYLNYFN